MTIKTIIKSDYKKTLIGIIPKDWELKKFKNIAIRKSERFDPLQNPNVKDLELDSLEQKSGKIINVHNSTDFKSSKYTFFKGDVLFGRLRPYLRKYWLAEFDGVCSTEIWVLKNKKNITSEYLFYSVQTKYYLRFADISSGTKMPRSDWSIVKNAKLPIPPLPEQKAIADCLTTWDKAIEKQKKLIAAKKLQKKGLMQQIFNGQLKVENACPEQGRRGQLIQAKDGEDFTKDWKEVKLGDLGKTFNGLTGKTKDDFGVGSSFVSYLNVFRNNKIEENTSFDYVNIGSLENQNTLNYGDLIFTTSSETPNEVGISSVILFKPQEKLYLNSFCFGMRLNDFSILKPEFAVYLLRGQSFRKEMYKLAQGSTRYNLSKTSFIKIQITVPSIEEQIAIAEILQTADKEIELLEKQLTQLELQKKGLMQVLLTGALRLCSGTNG